jgi:hypothetical protein
MLIAASLTPRLILRYIITNYRDEAVRIFLSKTVAAVKIFANSCNYRINQSPTDLTAEYSTEDTTLHWLNLIHISDRNFSIPRNNFKLIAIPVVAKHLS